MRPLSRALKKELRLPIPENEGDRALSNDVWTNLLRDAFSGDAKAQRRLLEEIWPIVHARIAKVLRLHGGPYTNVRQEVEDLLPEVLIALISNDWRLPKMWHPERGRSFPNFIGKLTEWRVCSMLRKRASRPWIEEGMDENEDAIDKLKDEAVCPDDLIASRELAEHVYDGARARLTEFGWRIFEMIVLEQMTPEALCAVTGMTPNAAHVWRHRIRKLINQLIDEHSSEERRRNHG